MCELLPIILACDDGCPNTRYSKVVHETDDCGETDVPRKGFGHLELSYWLKNVHIKRLYRK